MAYARRRATNSQFDSPFSSVPRLDISTHQCLQVLDVVLDRETWRVINFYHDVRDESSLQALISLDINASTPILVVGDFNTLLEMVPFRHTPVNLGGTPGGMSRHEPTYTSQQPGGDHSAWC
jgi:hypothetical protein